MCDLVGDLSQSQHGVTEKTFSTSSARERNRVELYKQLRKKNYTLIIERENLRSEPNLVMKIFQTNTLFRQQLEDTKTDISILRENIHKSGRYISSL